MRKIAILPLVIASLSCHAQELGAQRPPLIGNASLSLGVHSQGFMINIMRTGYSRFGFFVGYAGTSRKESDLPTEADFSWITYSNEDSKSKNAYHAGVAFRVNSNFQLGIGYGGKSTEYYHWGYGVSGLPFRSTNTRSKSESGVVGILDFGQARGWGGQIIGGANGFGAGISFRL